VAYSSGVLPYPGFLKQYRCRCIAAENLRKLGFEFEAVARRAGIACLDGGDITSNAGRCYWASRSRPGPDAPVCAWIFDRDQIAEVVMRVRQK
jgi:hypothetical protein